MRDRLIELIKQAHDGCVKISSQKLADYLLENGVVVLNKENNSVEDMIELLKAQIAVLQGWVERDGK